MPQLQERTLEEITGASEAITTGAGERSLEDILGGETPKPGGASGGWESPTTQVFRKAVTPLAQLGEGSVDAAKGLLSMPGVVYSAATTPPQTEAEKVVAKGGIWPMLAKRLIIDPQVAEAQKAAALPAGLERTGHAIAAATPLIGPLAAHIGERAGTGDIFGAAGEALGYATFPKIGSEVVGKLIKPRPFIPLAPRDSVSALSQVIRPGIKRGAPQEAAVTVQPLYKQSMQEAGIDPVSVALKEKSPKTDVYGDLYRGTTDAGLKAATDKLRATDPTIEPYDPKNPTPLPILVADHAVEIANRPFVAVIDHFKDVPVPDVQNALAGKLEGLSKQYTKLDAPLSEAYAQLAENVRNGPGTVGSIFDLKVHANKETARLFKLSPAGETAASATPIWAQRTLADEVRQILYPKITQLGGPNLFDFGKIEAHAINARDGVYVEWAKAAGDNAPSSLQSYFDYVLEGHSGVVRASFFPKSAANIGVASRALKGRPMPLREFNKLFQGGIGDVKNFAGNPAHMPLASSREMGPNFGKQVSPGIPLPNLPIGPAQAALPGAGIGEVPSEVAMGGRMPGALQPGGNTTGFMEQLKQRQAYKAGEPVLEKGQLDLQKGIPPRVFGLDMDKAISAIHDDDIIGSIQQYSQNRTAKTDWAKMSNTERQAEFLKNAKEDLRAIANSYKQGREKQSPLQYAERRAADPTDPLAGVYELFAKKLKGEGGSVGGGKNATRVGKEGLFPRSPLNAAGSELPPTSTPRPAGMTAQLRKTLSDMPVGVARDSVPQMQAFKQLSPEIQLQVKLALKNNDMRTVTRLLTE